LNNINPGPGTAATDIVAWAYNSGIPFYPIKINTSGSGCTFAGTGWDRPKGNMFTFGKLKNHAIIADVISSSDRQMMSHKNGVCVLYANGSARFQPNSLYKVELTRSPGTFDSGGNGNWIVDQIWNNFDAETQLYP
jgi:hypothetical protein